MRLRLPIHGRDHRPGGADPIKGMILFDAFNGTDGPHYFYINASGTIPGPGVGVLIAGNGLLFNDQDADTTFNARVLTVNASDAVDLFTDGTVTIDATGATPAHGISLNGATVVNLGTVGNFLGVNNHLGDRIFEVDEDGTIHIPTGATIVADL